jgi:hypothetical protein
MWQAAYRIDVSRSISGWQINLQPYSIRPKDSLVFKIAAEGDFQSLYHMINTGQASPFDRDENGKTLLHYAFESTDIDTIRFLLNSGVDVTNKVMGNLIETYCVFHRPLFPGLVDLIADLLDGSEFLRDFYCMRGHELNVTEIHKIMLTMNGNYHKQNLSARVQELEHIFNWVLQPRALRFFLWPSGEMNQAELDPVIRHRISWTMGRTIIITNSLRALDRLELQCAIYLDYRQLSELCYDEDLSFALGYYTYLSPLFAYLCGAWQMADILETISWAGLFEFPRVAANLHDALRDWLYFVAHRWPDLSLEIYGREMVEPFVLEHRGKYLFGKRRAGRPESESWWEENSSMGVVHPPRLIGLTYGSHIDDWSIEWDFEHERFAGEFWATISSQEAYMTCSGMPGAWPADMEFF